MKIKLILCFDGTKYCGWQVQKNAVSVQEKVQDAVEAVWGKRYSVTGCSRTDSGVHANMFCCTVETDHDVTIPFEKIPVAFNHNLPDDISVLSAEQVCESFHPRYDVDYKEYEYLIWNSQIRNPFLVGRAFEYRIGACFIAISAGKPYSADCNR